MRTDRIWQDHPIDRRLRAAMKHQRACVLWFTGLSGAGKSTLAGMVEQQLVGMGAHTYLLDGDSLRQGLCRDLGFSPASRSENVRRIGEISRLMADAGLIVLVACISPYRQDRQLVRELLGHEEFIEVHVDAPLEECERRDPKGLYQKARAGQIADFTGIHAPYEAPAIPAIHLRTAVYSARECTDQAVDYLMVRGYVAG